MDIENKRILVTGAGGFIGSHLTERLLDMGSKVTAFLRYNSRSDFGFLNKVEHDNLEILQGDLRDQHSVLEAVRDKDLIFHLGALIAIPYSYINPWDAFETNVKGTLNILTAANHLGTEKVINTSTSETYGTARYIPINEEHPLQGQSPYSASKIASDKFVESYISSYDLPVATLRPFNTYGPRQSSRAVIPTIITQVLTQDFLKLGSLSPTRDFTFVKDTVEGFVKVAESDKTIGEVTNIGSGAEISIGHIAKKIISIIGKEIQIKEDAVRKRPSKSEVHRLVCDNSKAKKLFDWEPSHSLDEGLKITINWVRDNLDIYDPKNYTV